MQEDLWQKYCSFLEKNFKSQIQWNETYMNNYFRDFKETRMAGQLCPGGVLNLKDVPLTTFSDYTILHEFGEKIQKLMKEIPREKSEPHEHYYDKLGGRLKGMFDGWMADSYSICIKTSGTTGESKWVVHGKTFRENMETSIMSIMTICCSAESGRTSFTRGDTLLGFGAPAPYIGGYLAKVIEREGIKMVPPLEVVRDISDFKKRMQLALKYFKKAEKIDIIGGSGSIIKLLTLYFANRKELYRSHYETTGAGIQKIILWLLWKYESAFGRKAGKLKDIVHPKGLITGSFDTELYLDFIEEQLGIQPTNIFGATELGFPLYGRPGDKSSLYPDLRTGYFEFLDSSNHIRKIDELEMGETYEFIFTPFRSLIMRYKTGDILRVKGFLPDGMPYFDYESRIINMIDIHNYFRLSLSGAFKAFNVAGFPPSGNWAFTKEIEPKERLLLLMEDEFGLTKQEVAKKIFHALKATNQEFCNYINDFKIKNPGEILEVHYVKRGTFRRYTEEKLKQGVPMGRIKPFRIITPDQADILKFLRSA